MSLSPADVVRAARQQQLTPKFFNHLAMVVKGFQDTEPDCAVAVLGAFVSFAAKWGKQMHMSQSDFVDYCARVFGDLES